MYIHVYIFKNLSTVRPWWLMSVILATQEAEIRRIMVRSQPWQIVNETLSRKNPSQKRAGGVTQGVGPEVKPHLIPQKKKKKKESKYNFKMNTKRKQ
jgi:hypothetical protein